MAPDDDKTRTHVTLTSGTMVSHYRIIEKIGAGGMGEVYLAEDTNLNRQIAIKVLPDMFGNDQERLARFEREAKLLASLNHQNLATIHGLDNVQGKRLLVMELVEGETLAERIARGPLPLDDALDVLHQIAAGMEAAHEKGIIHRDLKPANIKLTPDGKVKILDFGLAKAIHGETVASDLANSPTITENMTRAGVILGTAAYMSPEQAKGKPVDKRTDIWAFGCIVYECLTGKRAFGGETTSETLAAVLRGEPDWDKLPAQTPSHVRSLLRRCLQKDSTRRLRDIGDARIEVGDSSLDTAAIPEARGRSWRELTAWAIAVLAVAVVVILWIANERRQPAEEEATFSQIPPPTNSVSCFHDGFSLSPDGRKIAFSSLSSKGERLVWVRFLDRQDAAPIVGTEDASYPFWSPDSRQIAFYAGGKLKRVALEGGPVQSICAASLVGRASSWGSAGVILFTDVLGGISSVSETGGEPTTAVAVVTGGADLPSFLPDGRRFLYVNWSGSRSSVYVASLDGTGVGKEIAGTSDVARVEWMPPDRLVLWRAGDRSLVTQRVDLTSAGTGDRSNLIAERVAGPNGIGSFSVSPANVLAYVANPPEARNDYASRMVWVDRKGNVLGNLGETGSYWYARISPDGRQVAVSPDDDIWLFDVSTGLPTRFTNEMASGSWANWPVWSPQSDRIVSWCSNCETKEFSISGNQKRDILKDSTFLTLATDWSRDGKYLAITRNGQVAADLAYLETATNRLESFLATPSYERDGQFSPDGRWMAYASNETGTFEIYMRSFPDGKTVKRVSYTGGMHPRWRGDGQELFFLAPGWTVMAAQMRFEPALEIGTPEKLFEMVMADFCKGTSSPYDVSPDGQRFLVISPQTKPVSLTLMQNWQALVDREE